VKYTKTRQGQALIAVNDGFTLNTSPKNIIYIITIPGADVKGLI